MQTQNAIFLTALQHFSSYITFTDSTESLSIHTYPSPPPAPVPVSAKEVMVVGMKQRKRWVETQPGCSWAGVVVPFGDFWLLFTFPLYIVTHNGGNTIPVTTLRERKGDRGAWRRPKNPYRECTLNPPGPLQSCPLRFLPVCTNLRPDGLSLLSSPWSHLVRWP